MANANITHPGTYAGEAARPYVAAAVLSADTIANGYVSTIENVHSKAVLRKFSGVSMAAVALLVLPLAHFMVPGEQLTLRKALGFGMGFAGAVVLIGGQAFETTGLALELALWGGGEGLAFLTPPPSGALAEAQALLHALGALEKSRITPHGRVLARLPLHPRLAHMLHRAGPQAATLSALLADRDPLRGAPSDLALQESARVLFHLPERPKEKPLRQMAEAWSPWRSVAARALWAYYHVAKDREGIA